MTTRCRCPPERLPGIRAPNPLPAREFLWVTQKEALRWPEPCAGEGVSDERGFVAAHLLHPKALGNRVIDRVPGIEGAEGVLLHHLHL